MSRATQPLGRSHFVVSAQLPCDRAEFSLRRSRTGSVVRIEVSHIVIGPAVPGMGRSSSATAAGTAPMSVGGEARRAPQFRQLRTLH
jgi:hypothetical protein